MVIIKVVPDLVEQAGSTRDGDWATTVKVVVVHSTIAMAIHPTDKVPQIMQEEFGTRVLITDPKADRILNRAAREKSDQKKFTQFCGGVGGWNDLTERWH